MSERSVLTGNDAAAFACRDCRVQVVAAYPITPQSPLTERISRFVADGEMDARYVCVESEHTAITVCIGAASAGARTFTASSANGLCLMHEQLHWAAGARLPIVMACVNRGVAAPWTIWTDHQDSISQRDTGWVQLYVESNQEIYDTIIQAYRLAERLLVPVMVCYDGYSLSHTAMPVLTEGRSAVDTFLPPFDPPIRLDPDHPLSFGAVTLPEPRRDHPGLAEFGAYMEIRQALQQDLTAAIAAVEEVDADFQRAFGRAYGGALSSYKTDDAELVILAMGTVASESKVAADLLRHRGLSVGVVSLRLYRPFPADLVKALAGRHPRMLIIDRAVSYGYEGPLATDVKAAMFGLKDPPRLSCCVAGLGGREISAEMIAGMAEEVLHDGTAASCGPQQARWINLHPARTAAETLNSE